MHAFTNRLLGITETNVSRNMIYFVHKSQINIVSVSFLVSAFKVIENDLDSSYTALVI